MKYNFSHSLVKTIIRVVISAVPLVMAWMPDIWANMTISGILLLLLDWAKSNTKWA